MTDNSSTGPIWSKTAAVVLAVTVFSAALTTDASGVAQPALLVSWLGGAVLGDVWRGRSAIGTATIVVASAALRALAIVTSIHLKSGADFAVALPIMIPLAAVPSLAAALFVAALAGRDDEPGG